SRSRTIEPPSRRGEGLSAASSTSTELGTVQYPCLRAHVLSYFPSCSLLSCCGFREVGVGQHGRGRELPCRRGQLRLVDQNGARADDGRRQSPSSSGPPPREPRRSGPHVEGGLTPLA